MINGERVRQARELRGWTQIKLAEFANVTQGAIAQIESGYSQPSSDLMTTIALRTGFPLAFFRQESPTSFPPGSLLFRARKTMSAAQRSQAHQYARVVYESIDKMSQRVNGIKVRLPMPADDPEDSARLTREALDLTPDRPIKHVVHAVEKAGVLVIALPVDLDKRDAFSSWVGEDAEKPVIVLSGDAPGDRLRFSVCHELGHLVLHRSSRTSVSESELEEQANLFASEFLMPEQSIRHELAPPITLAGLAKLKPRWGVSIQALIRRAYALEVITQRQYKYLFQKLSARGWRTREPDELAVRVEKPRAARQMAELLYGDPIDFKKLAEDVNLTEQFVKEILEAHASKGTSAVKRVQPERGQLLRLNGRGEER